MFSALSKTKIIILSTLILSSAIPLNLDQSKILSSGKELNLVHKMQNFKNSERESLIKDFKTGENCW